MAEVEKVKCELCGREFKSKRGLWIHRRTVHSEPQPSEAPKQGLAQILLEKAEETETVKLARLVGDLVLSGAYKIAKDLIDFIEKKESEK